MRLDDKFFRANTPSKFARDRAVRNWKKWARSEKDEHRKSRILHAISCIARGQGEESNRGYLVSTEYGSFWCSFGGNEFSIQWKA